MECLRRNYIKIRNAEKLYQLLTDILWKLEIIKEMKIFVFESYSMSILTLSVMSIVNIKTTVAVVCQHMIDRNSFCISLVIRQSYVTNNLCKCFMLCLAPVIWHKQLKLFEK
jgi:hypothetical protein